MEDPGKGRGRGAHLLQLALSKSNLDSPPRSEETTPGSSAAPSVVGEPTVGGRGRAAMLLSLMQRPGVQSFSPACDVSSKLAAPVSGVGRGLKIMQTLRAAQSAKPAEAVGQGDVDQITHGIAESTISGLSTDRSSVPKNKPFREVKDTPPVVMKGSTGTPCDVTSNFIYLKFEESSVYEYEVKYEPDQDYRAMRFKLLNQHREYFAHKTFDGTTLYLPHGLPDDALNLVSTNPYDNSTVLITIVFRRTRHLREMVHIFNVLFKQIMKDLKLVQFGRQYFCEHAAIQIPQHKLEVWPGYVTAVDEYEGGLMLTLDSTHRVLRTQTVLSLIKEMTMTQGVNWKRAITDVLVGCSVMTTYNNKLFRVDIIDETMTPKSTFEKKEGKEMVKISYIDYYKKNYGIEIMDWDQPMLISRETKRQPGSDIPTEFLICLVPELCQLTGLTDDQRGNFRLMKDVATYTRVTPNQRHYAFKQFIKNVMENDDARNRLKGWGMSLAPETINITARTLPPETLLFGNNVKVAGKPNADWNGEVSRQPMLQAVDLMRWTVLHTDRDRQAANDFVETVKRCSRPMGMGVSAPEMVRLPNDRIDSYIMALKKCITSATQMVVAVCPTSRDDRYAAIKQICCVENPVPSQVINARTIMNQQKIRQITQKILLQINVKLGGTLWSIPIPFKSAMIVGIDTYHDNTRKKRSVCSFVASYNQPMTHWYSKAVFHEQGQEIANSLKSCLAGALQHFMRTNSTLPEKIIMYRDGVGDGQLKVIRDFEIPQMKVSLKQLGENYCPKLTYIVVQKRINTRIFLKEGHELGNPPPGTVVDHAITRRDWFDFLIASQKVNQGTVTPTHYVVLYDDSGMTPDQCQRLTYKLCHLYYNWPGTVRVPAPCQYAHKLSYLVGQSVHQEPSSALSDKLFYL